MYFQDPNVIRETLLPLTDNLFNLGSSSFRIKDIYGSGWAYLNGANKGIQILNGKTIDSDLSGAVGTGILTALLTTGTDTVLLSGTGANASGVTVNVAKTRATTTDANTIVQVSDVLFDLRVWGSDGATYRESSRLQAIVDTTPGVGDMGGAWVFMTSADGAATPLERWRINSSGQLLQNATNGGNIIFTSTSTALIRHTNDTNGVQISGGSLANSNNAAYIEFNGISKAGGDGITGSCIFHTAATANGRMVFKLEHASASMLVTDNTGAALWNIAATGTFKNFKTSNEVTGAGTALLGANCPAVTVTAPQHWMKMKMSDDSDVYFPVWK